MCNVAVLPPVCLRVPNNLTSHLQLMLPTAIPSTSCFSVPNGTATVAGAGGIPGYTYSWSTSPTQTTATATGLSAGTYTVTVTDKNGCKTSSTITISQPTVLALTANSFGVSCGGIFVYYQNRSCLRLLHARKRQKTIKKQGAKRPGCEGYRAGIVVA